jgi:KaiC/GvpD/RAD55 family RecA-like ATPase
MGIPGLEQLLSRRNPQHRILTVAGGPGTGKSLLCLHAAAEYLRSHADASVIYISTDYTSEQAEDSLKNFALDKPKKRLDALKKAYYIDPNYQPAMNTSINFRKAAISDEAQRIKVLMEKRNTIVYLDLQTVTVGDEWYFVNSLINYVSSNAKPTLIIVDAVEGLEAFTDGKDGFGEMQSRRSRVHQLVTSVRKSESLALILVIEDEDATFPEPEEFLTDVDIKLSSVEDEAHYLHRYIELVKVRSYPHARGRHELKFCGESGTSTGVVSNVDEPKVVIPGNDGTPPLRVIPSLHSWNSNYAAISADVSTPAQIPSFRLRLIDNLLGRLPSDLKLPTQTGWSLTLLVGDPGTCKSQLARAFMAAAIQPDGEPPANDNYLVEGAVIYLTTDLTDRKIAIGQLSDHVAHRVYGERYESHQRDPIVDSVTQSDLIKVRRIGARNISSSMFIEIVRKHLLWAKSRFNENKPVRLVIDDWRALLETHPALLNDTRLLPTLRDLLMSEQVHALFVCTQSGSPYSEKVESFERSLKDIDSHQLLFWNVPFLGERRIAVTTLRERRSTHSPEIYTIKPRSNGCDAIEVTRELSLFKDIEIGNKQPSRVELDLKLNEANRKRYRYSSKVRRLLSEICPVVERQKKYYRDYDSRATHPDVFDDQPSETSIILEVDEFWSPKHKGLLNLADYLTGPEDASTDDPYASFRSLQELKRWKFFTEEGIKFPSEDDARQADRIPYYWDFGFLVVSDDAYELKEFIRTPPEPLQWPKFLEDFVPYPNQTLSLGNTSLENLVCLFLEIWFSELDNYPPLKDAIAEIKTRSWVQPGTVDLKSILQNPDGKLATFRAANLFAFATKGLAIDSRRKLVFRKGFTTVATRHFFSTLANVDGSTVFCPLPGNYSVRGDWFLATTKGSRSWLLAERVFDILSSRTQSLTRMIDGVGLPVRDVVEVASMDDLLLFPNTNTTYERFKKMGKSEVRNWLWRSSIKDYPRIAYFFRNWVARLISTRDNWAILKHVSDFQSLNACNSVGSAPFFTKMIDLLISAIQANEVDARHSTDAPQ